MVHTVDIIKFVPGTSLTFRIDGKTWHARCKVSAADADELLVEGSSYPVALTVEADGKVEYTTPGTPAVEILHPSDSGDRIRVTGRTWDSVSHQVIKLDANPSVGLKLNLPQTATDYRGGSWLTAEGILCADLPPEEHD